MSAIDPSWFFVYLLEVAGQVLQHQGQMRALGERVQQPHRVDVPLQQPQRPQLPERRLGQALCGGSFLILRQAWVSRAKCV